MNLFVLDDIFEIGWGGLVNLLILMLRIEIEDSFVWSNKVTIIENAEVFNI